MICPNCHMLKSNCICGNNNKSTKSETKEHKINKEMEVDSPQGSIDKKIYNYKLKSNTEKNISKDITLPSTKSQEKIFSEIYNSIKEGYKFIVLELNNLNSDIAIKLAKDFKNSIILTANEMSQLRYNKKYQLRNNPNIILKTQKNLFEENNIEKTDLLIFDDAHRLDENIVNLFSYTINLNDYDELINNFKYKVNDLPKKDYTHWIDFINYLSLDNEKIKRIISCIKQNPENWICSYDDSYFYNRLSFYPLYIGKIANEYWFSKGEVCILISSSILDFKLFTDELGLDSSKVKFIHHDLPVNLYKNKIYARKTVNMHENNLELLIPLIKEILEKHDNEKGLILTNRLSYSNYILRQIKDQRLLTYRNFDYYKKLKKFNERDNSVIVTDFLEDGREFSYDQCKFQIIVKQHSYAYNERSK